MTDLEEDESEHQLHVEYQTSKSQGILELETLIEIEVVEMRWFLFVNHSFISKFKLTILKL